jgi:hypothetical protein
MGQACCKTDMGAQQESNRISEFQQLGNPEAITEGVGHLFDSNVEDTGKQGRTTGASEEKAAVVIQSLTRSHLQSVAPNNHGPLPGEAEIIPKLPQRLAMLLKEYREEYKSFCKTLDDTAYSHVAYQLPQVRFKDGAVYIGQWYSHKPTNQGIMIYPDDTIYDGEWTGGEWHGKGRRIQGHEIYEGSFLKGLMHGIGKYLNSTGSSYNGMWKENQQCGHGEEVWPDGAKYEGKFVDGKKNGYGTF